MKRFIRYYCLYLLLIAGIISCKRNFLEIEDNSRFYRQAYVSNLATMQEFMTGIYLDFAAEFQFAGNASYPEVIADNLKLFSPSSPVLQAQYGWSQVANETDKGNVVSVNVTSMNPLWKVGYKIIRECSFVIEDIDQYRNENPVKADDIKGQAFAMRALVHFILTNTFAQNFSFTTDASHLGIPYITTSDISAAYRRQTVAEDYNLMISDINEALNLLAYGKMETRTFTQVAAKAMLARIYLFKGDYEKAVTTAKEVCSAVPLLSIDSGYPDRMFRLVPLNQTETLFQLSPQGSGKSTYFLGAWLNGDFTVLYATTDIAVLLTENGNDVRRSWVASVSGQWKVVKFPKSAAPEVTPAVQPAAGAYYHPVIRSSEMFLTVSEAAAKLGDEQTSRQFLDAVRQRSDPSLSPIVATGTALLDSIYKERRKELAFEGLRMYDLQRWHFGVNRLDVLSGFRATLPYPDNKAIAPIPVEDINLAGLNQNEGY